jgi:hypothetical protein
LHPAGWRSADRLASSGMAISGPACIQRDGDQRTDFLASSGMAISGPTCIQRDGDQRTGLYALHRVNWS